MSKNQNQQKKIQYFRIKGSFKERGSYVNFTRDVRSLTPEDAKEQIFNHFGSKHKLKRLSIQINTIDIIKQEDTSNIRHDSIGEADFKLIRG